MAVEWYFPTPIFVHTFSGDELNRIQTEISNELATTITVGAQANGAVKGQDSTSFSKWNSGITDRILPIKSTTNPTGSSATTSEDTTTGDINVEYQNQISEYSSWVSWKN